MNFLFPGGVLSVYKHYKSTSGGEPDLAPRDGPSLFDLLQSDSAEASAGVPEAGEACERGSVPAGQPESAAHEEPVAVRPPGKQQFEPFERQ